MFAPRNSQISNKILPNYKSSQKHYNNKILSLLHPKRQCEQPIVIQKKKKKTKDIESHNASYKRGREGKTLRPNS